MKMIIGARRLACSNKGSTIVTVVVSMLFVMALGAALLFSAYTAYKIAAVERQDKETFYTADSAMDDVRVGLQGAVTKALVVSYTQVLKEYSINTEPDYDPQARLAEVFKGSLLQSSAELQKAQLRIFESSTYGGTETVSYRPAALNAFVSAPDGVSAVVGSADSFDSPDTYSGNVVLKTDDSGRLSVITLKAISLKYTENGYESNITADISIAVPDFYARPILTGNMSSYAIVANGGVIKESNGSSTVNGKVYAGGVTVSGTDNKLTITKGDLISPGQMEVTNGSFVFDAANNELWAKDIDANNGAVSLNGRAYVANDLSLGKNGKATLAGSYFGFGNEVSKPDKSSAILVNGKDAKLDISSLKRLSLAGVSFIDITRAGLQNSDNSNYTAPIPMGESMSIKSNQLAYLVPAECIHNYSSNPMVFNGTEVEAPSYSMASALWKIGNQNRTLKDYLGGGKGEIKTLYKNVDGGNIKLAYVFLLFKEQRYANEYFRDYFQVYPDRISQYMEFYLELSDKGTDAEINTAGNSFYMDDRDTPLADDDVLTLVPTSAAIWSNSLQTRFDSMKSPYDDFVNAKAMQELKSGAVLKFEKNGKTVAVVTNRDYSHNGSSSGDIKLIVSEARVSVSGNYNGMLLTKGELELSGSITGIPFDNSLLDATCTYNGNGKEYILSDFVGGGISAPTDDSNAWAPDKMVYYENWTKK